MATASLSHQPSALADAPSDEAVIEQRRAAAKSKYQEGAAAYSAGHFKDAVDLFLAADRLAPSAPLSFNIARAYEKLADDAGALRWYRDYLRRNPEASNAATVRPLIAALAESLRKKGVQQLTVITSPPGATLAVDDQAVGVTPWTGELSPGAHHLLLNLRGYADSETNLSLAADQPLDVSVRLEQQQAPASVQAQPLTPTPTPPASATPATEASSHGKKLGVVPWVTLAAGTAALGGALTFELLRRSAESDAKDAQTQLEYQEKLETMQSRQTAARIFLGAGGALLLGGGLMLLLDKGSSSHSTSAGLICLPNGCAAAARGNF
jgi:tetratricopeptide (TPR) repeat protein